MLWCPITQKHMCTVAGVDRGDWLWKKKKSAKLYYFLHLYYVAVEEDNSLFSICIINEGPITSTNSPRHIYALFTSFLYAAQNKDVC